MKEDWLNDIHDRMADYEADEPQGLWDDLCRARAQEELRRKSRLAFRTWTSRIAAGSFVCRCGSHRFRIRLACERYGRRIACNRRCTAAGPVG